jgi:hypothetical protein
MGKQRYRRYRRLDKTRSWFDRDTAQPFPLIPDPPHDAEFGEPFIEEKAFYQARYQGLEWLRDHPEGAEFATTPWRVHDGATHDVVWCMQRYQILDLGLTPDDDLCFVEVSLDEVYRWFEKRDLEFPQVLLDDLEREDCRKPNAPPSGVPETDPARKRLTLDERRLKVKAMIEALDRSELWGVMPEEIARRSQTALSTLYRYLRHPSVKKTWERYQRESAGKTPANLDDLGDARMFSFSDGD